MGAGGRGPAGRKHDPGGEHGMQRLAGALGMTLLPDPEDPGVIQSHLTL